ncbi:MAG: cation diffusion facilitator family transporter [Opitutaceae bacterium]|jgi:cation diffusion facilitator family transporter
MHHASTESGGNRESATRTAVIVGGIDLLVTLSAWIAANSSVILADFFKTLLEFIAVLLAWLTIRRIQKGANHEFDYGIGKLENLSSLIVGVLMFFCLLVIVFSSVRSLLHPSHITGIGVWISLVSQIVYGVINARICIQSKRMARERNSPLMASQAGLFFTKAVGNGFILLSLCLSSLLGSFSWSLYIDPVASLIIAASILLAALGIFKNSTLDLLDRTLEEHHQIAILRSLARHFDRYDELLEVRSRRSGSQVFVEIILGFSPELKAAEVEATARALKAELEKEIPGSRVTIGVA